MSAISRKGYGTTKIAFASGFAVLPKWPPASGLGPGRQSESDDLAEGTMHESLWHARVHSG